MDAGTLIIALRTVSVSGVATALAILVGVPLGYWLARRRFAGRTILLGFINTGMGMPPVVVGLVVWLLLTETDRFREPMMARTAGLTIALVAAQLALTDNANAAYALTFAVAVAGFAMYLRIAAEHDLAVGVLGVTLVVPEAVIDWTDGALGPAGAVLVAGLTLLAASLGGFRMRKELEQPEEDRPAKAVDELV